MRLLFVSTMFGPDAWGASEELWRITAHAALNAGHEVVVSVRRRASTPPQLLELEAAGARLIQRRDRYGRFERARRRVLGYPTVRLLDEFRPQVVLFSNAYAYDVLADPGVFDHTITWCRRNEFPYVALIHAVDHGRVLNDIGRAQARAYFANAATVAGVSHGNLDAIRAHTGLALDNAVVVRNPIRDLGLLPWLGDETPGLAAVGRLNMRTKGQDLLLHALAELQELPWRFSIYGEGEDEGSLRSTAQTLGISSRVRFRGHRDIAEIWADEHALVSASHMEGMSIAVVEAMLAGRPVAATAVGGVTEWVKDGVEGYVIDRPDTSLVVEGLRRLLKTPDLEEMGQRARQRALELADPDPAGTLLRLLTAVGSADK